MTMDKVILFSCPPLPPPNLISGNNHIICDLGNDKGVAPGAALTSVPEQRVVHLCKVFPLCRWGFLTSPCLYSKCDPLTSALVLSTN